MRLLIIIIIIIRLFFLDVTFQMNYVTQFFIIVIKLKV